MRLCMIETFTFCTENFKKSLLKMQYKKQYFNKWFSSLDINVVC